MSSIFETSHVLEPPSRPAGVELIPGTSLPLHAGPGGEQAEGRGGVELRGERLAPSLASPSEQDGLSEHERMLVAALLRAYDRAPLRERHVFAQVGDETGATTGNAVVPLFTVPAGWEAHVALVNVDAPGSTLTPAAPLANASVFAWLAISASGTWLNGQADGLRAGLVAFAPTAAAGPVVPFTWTFNDSNAPIAFGGETIYYVLHGGSIAGATNLQLQVSYRLNLFAKE